MLLSHLLHVGLLIKHSMHKFSILTALLIGKNVILLASSLLISPHDVQHTSY